MRLFAAVELDAAVKRAAAAAVQALRARLPRGFDARWVPPENLHVTLWFLGEIEDARVPPVLAALEPSFDVDPFLLRVDGFGAFPAAGAPQVLWLGIQEGARELAELHDRIAFRLEPLGFARDRRPFRAHLTIARVRRSGPARGGDVIRGACRDVPAHAGASLVSDVTLFRSRLLSKGAVHEPLLRVPLRR